MIRQEFSETAGAGVKNIHTIKKKEKSCGEPRMMISKAPDSPQRVFQKVACHTREVSAAARQATGLSVRTQLVVKNTPDRIQTTPRAH